MFTHTSRYSELSTRTLRRPDGRVVIYAERRILPGRTAGAAVFEVPVEDGGRLDNIAAATLGAPELYWRICDAGNALDPTELEVVGTILKVPVPGSHPR